jgi:hypothetical protein
VTSKSVNLEIYALLVFKRLLVVIVDTVPNLAIPIINAKESIRDDVLYFRCAVFEAPCKTTNLYCPNLHCF